MEVLWNALLYVINKVKYLKVRYLKIRNLLAQAAGASRSRKQSMLQNKARASSPRKHLAQATRAPKRKHELGQKMLAEGTRASSSRKQSILQNRARATSPRKVLAQATRANDRQDALAQAARVSGLRSLQAILPPLTM